MAIEIRVPELGESVVEATVGRWLKKEGERVSAGETVVELETDKVDLEVGAESAGTLTHIAKQQGEDVHVGDVLGIIEPVTEQAGAPAVAPSVTPGVQEPERMGQPKEPVLVGGDGDKTTPVAARYAQERGIDLAQVHGTGPGGRVTKQDVQDFVEKQHEAPKPQPEPSPTIRRDLNPPSSPPAPAPATRERREERMRMSRRRRTIAERMLQASQTTAILTTFNEVDMSRVMDIRQRRKESFKERYGIGLGLTSFFVKATIAALRAFPPLNSEIQGDEIVIKHYYDIGVAVGATEGLVVPVLRDADRMSFADIERKTKEFAKKADDGTLSIEDLRGGTFTITNGGVFGSLMSTPILNIPQVGILGLHKIEDRPVAVNGQVEIRPMMYVAVSYDHRVVDGREAVQFLVRIKEMIQDPESLLIEG